MARWNPPSVLQRGLEFPVRLAERRHLRIQRDANVEAFGIGFEIIGELIARGIAVGVAGMSMPGNALKARGVNRVRDA